MHIFDRIAEKEKEYWMASPVAKGPNVLVLSVPALDEFVNAVFDSGQDLCQSRAYGGCEFHGMKVLVDEHPGMDEIRVGRLV